MKPQPPNTTWTQDQWRAIATDDRSLLVSAAAGSGKTSVLAERCAFLVCDADEPCDIDQLLAITFTKAAAAEMRSRIGDRLRARLENNHGDARLQKQLLLIDRASITTLDAFCGSIVRRHFQLVGLDPSFIQLDEEEAGLLRRETARALLEDRYDADADGSFQHLIDQLAEGNDDRIVGQLLHISALRGSLIDPAGWIATAKSRLQSAAESFAGSQIEAELRDYAERMIVESILQAERAEAQLAELPNVARVYVPYMQALNAELVEWQIALADSFDAFAERFNAFEAARLPNAKADADEKKLGQDLINSVRDEMKKGKLAELAGFTAAEWQAGIASTSAAATTLLNLVEQFDAAYAKAKSDLRALDFADLGRFAFHILRDEQSPALAPSPVAVEYQRQYRHVLVDEYQDINALQDAIISLLSREGTGNSKSNLFCVGDVKQSIYRFRLAEPKNFLGRQKRLKAGDARRGETIDLQANFRSRGPLLDTINLVFHRLMTPVVEIDYDDSHTLVPKLPYLNSPAGFTGKPIELHVIDAEDAAEETGGDGDDGEDDLDNIELEALLIARRVRELMGLGTSPRRKVFDSKKGLFRPIEFRDIAILVRTAKFKSDQLAEILREHDVSVYTDSRGGFFDALEIRDLLALLRVLDNARQDVPLAAVLRSPIFQLPDAADSLAKVRVVFPPRDWPFHVAVTKYAAIEIDNVAERLSEILDQIDTWRDAAHRRPLAELIWRIYEESGYLAYVSAMPGGAQRVANLVELHSRARQFGTFQRQGLSRFLAFLESLREQQDVGRASVAGGAEEAVRIMSIHQSKGLEFPVVIVPDFGKGFNFQDANGRVLIDRDRFVGIRAIDQPKHIHYATAPWLLVRDELKRKMIAEEARVLYVALTRAREHLILIGSGKTKDVDRWLTDPLPPGERMGDDEILSATTPLDWLAPIARAIEFGEPGRFTIDRHSRAAVYALRGEGKIGGSTRSPDFQNIALLRVLKRNATLTAAANEIVDAITRRYTFEELTETPAAWSVTSVTKQGKLAPGAESRSRAGVVPFEAALPLPRFVAGDDGLTAAAAGSLTHLVMQYVDLADAKSANAVRRQVARFIDRRLVPDFAAGLVDTESIVWFAATPLGRAMAAAGGKVRRELPVVRTRDLDWEHGPMQDDDVVLLRGRLDALVPEAGGWRIVDYKTDAVTEATVEARGTFYRPQVNAYASAIADVTGERVVGASLVFLKARRVVELDV